MGSVRGWGKRPLCGRPWGRCAQPAFIGRAVDDEKPACMGPNAENGGQGEAGGREAHMSGKT